MARRSLHPGQRNGAGTAGAGRNSPAAERDPAAVHLPQKEGGETEISDEAYFELNRQAAVSGLTDVIDIELFNDEAQIRSLVSDAHAAGVKVIMSNHDFHKTPAQEDIIYRLRRMQDLGADLPKIAVMPQSPQDVLTLLSAT
jgi:3-dehydroquinate dehydratase-1